MPFKNGEGIRKMTTEVKLVPVNKVDKDVWLRLNKKKQTERVGGSEQERL